MLNVHTENLNNKKIMVFPEKIFNKNLKLILSNYDEVDQTCLRYIDKAELVHRGDEVWIKKGKSFYPITNISTGAKICMLVHHLPQMDGWLTLDGCGNNALTALFKYVQHSNVDLFLNHIYFDPDNKELSDVPICVNGKPDCTISDLWYAIP